MAPGERSGGVNGFAHGRVKSVVVVDFPEGREFLWLAADAPIVHWQIGDDVEFRSGSWRVTGRSAGSDALNLTLGPVP